MVEYRLRNGVVLKDGHTMFMEDIVKDLQRKAYLEGLKGKEGDSPALLSAEAGDTAGEVKRDREEIKEKIARAIIKDCSIAQKIGTAQEILEDIDELMNRLDR